MVDLRILSVGLPFLAVIADIVAIVVVLLGAKDRRMEGAFVAFAGCMALWCAALGLESIPGFAARHSSLITRSAPDVSRSPPPACTEPWRGRVCAVVRHAAQCFWRMPSRVSFAFCNSST